MSGKEHPWAGKNIHERERTSMSGKEHPWAGKNIHELLDKLSVYQRLFVKKITTQNNTLWPVLFMWYTRRFRSFWICSHTLSNYTLSHTSIIIILGAIGVCQLGWNPRLYQIVWRSSENNSLYSLFLITPKCPYTQYPYIFIYIHLIHIYNSVTFEFMYKFKDWPLRETSIYRNTVL